MRMVAAGFASDEATVFFPSLVGAHTPRPERWHQRKAELEASAGGDQESL